MAGELKLNQVSTPSTPASGKDALFVSTDTPERVKRVDPNGVVFASQEYWYMSQTADNTSPTNVNTAQAVFNTTTNGALTVPASTTFQFEAAYFLTNTGTTSHTWGVLFGGTATLTSGTMIVTAVTSCSTAVAAASQGVTTTLGSSFTATAASTSATENATFLLHGVVRINAGGTFIPQFQASAATGAAPVIKSGSYIRLSPVSSNTIGYMGPWS